MRLPIILFLLGSCHGLPTQPLNTTLRTLHPFCRPISSAIQINGVNSKLSMARVKAASIVDTFASTSQGTVDRNGPWGRVRGVAGKNANRFTIKYGTAARFAQAKLTGPSSHILDGTSLPPPCPQDDFYNPSTPSITEDCLYLTIYTPTLTGTAKSKRDVSADVSFDFPGPSPSLPKLPVLVWIHGGSLASGSASLPGLDGSHIAEKGVIVVVLQYRLGVFGFMHSGKAGEGNLGVRDVELGLRWIKNNINGFSGDSDRVTLAGQSSGASMVKTLLTVSSANSLFDNFIAQSPPLNYADQTPAVASFVQSLTLKVLGCKNIDCVKKKSVKEILDAQATVIENAHSSNPGVALGQTYAPVVDGSYIKGDFVRLMNNQAGGLGRKDRKGLLTSVVNEQCATVENLISDTPLPIDYFPSLVTLFLAPPVYRSNTILISKSYAPSPSEKDGTRDSLDLLGSDYMSTCPVHQAVVNMTSTKQGTFWVAQFTVGIPYPNAGSAYCDSKVAHQDDIPLLFGAGPVSATTKAQKLATAETLARWVSFVKTGNPNPPEYLNWAPVKDASHLNMLMIGGQSRDGKSSTVSKYRQGICDSGRKFWGCIGKVPFDSQLYS